MTPFDGYEDWEGGYAQLVLLGGGLLRAMAATAPPSEQADYEKACDINERLARQYVSVGVIAPGRREGRNVVFRFRQLVQLVVARYLLAVEKWKIPQIALLMSSEPTEELVQLLPFEDDSSPLLADEDMRLASVFEDSLSPFVDQAETIDPETPPDTPRRNLRLRRTSAQSQRDDVDDKFAELTRARMQFRRKLRALEEPPEASRWIRFEIAPWAELNVEESALDTWGDELIDQLSERLKHVIRAQAAERKRRR